MAGALTNRAEWLVPSTSKKEVRYWIDNEVLLRRSRPAQRLKFQAQLWLGLVLKVSVQLKNAPGSK